MDALGLKRAEPWGQSAALCVQELARETDERDLYDFFRDCGPVASVRQPLQPTSF